MNLNLKQNNSIDIPEITIEYKEMDAKLEFIINIVNYDNQKITAIDISNGNEVIVYIDDIYYIEAIDRKTFIYMEKDVFEMDKRLYELLNILPKIRFCQISKNIILNTSKLERVAQLPNSRLKSYLDNGEFVIVSRTYIDILRRTVKGQSL